MLKRGDIVLFKSTGRWYEEAICKATHGEYCHVEIALDRTYTIGAHVNGIVKNVFYAIPALYTAVDISDFTASDHIESALSWAEAQKGKEYGWADIVYQGIKFLFPNNPFQLTEQGHWDCSDFVTRYLQHAGVYLPDKYSDPYQNTPNDLARLFKLLPERG